MAFRRVERNPAREQEIVSALLSPKPNISDADVVAYLSSHGAETVSNLAPGFLSAQASREVLRGAEAIATVELKGTKAMHFGR